jgi:hypothetical protein
VQRGAQRTVAAMQLGSIAAGSLISSPLGLGDAALRRVASE